MNNDSVTPPGGKVIPDSADAVAKGRADPWDLDPVRTTIGRGPDCNIRINDENVSRLHAVLIWDGLELFLHQLGKKNLSRLERIPVVPGNPQKVTNSRNLIELTESIHLRVKILKKVPDDTATKPSIKTPRLYAIMLTDMVGYSRHVNSDPDATVVKQERCKQIFEEQVNPYKGSIVNSSADSILIVFDSATGAICAAIEAQRNLREFNLEYDEDQKMQYRIGITTGEVNFEPDLRTGEKIASGKGVIVAARLQEAAEPGGILVSSIAKYHAEDRTDFELEFASDVELKGMNSTIPAYRVIFSGSPS